MGWHGSWDIQYNGTNNEKFVKLAKLLIPNYIERFQENKAKNRLECTRDLSWYYADVDIAKIMEYLDENDTLDVTIYGETSPYFVDEDGEEQELECEKEFFRKENGKVVLDNKHPDEDRYRCDGLGIYDYLSDLEDINTYISFITREIGPDDKIMPIAQAILYDVFSQLEEDASSQPLVSKAAEMKARFANVETTKSFFKEMHEQQKDLIERQKAQQEQNEMEGIPQFLANMSKSDIRHLGGIQQLTKLVATLGEDKARETLQILGYDVGTTKLSDKKVEPETVTKQVASPDAVKHPLSETIKREQESISKLNQEIMQKSEGGNLKVDDLKKAYDYVSDRDEGIVIARKVEKRQVPYTLHLPDGTTIRKMKEETGRVAKTVFFLDQNGIATLIPELSYQAEGDLSKGPYHSSDSSAYGSSRKGSHTFDVQEWGFEGMNDEGQVGRFDKHYRYVALTDTQKLVKVFESEHYIDKPWGDLYHRNKDENGKQCIRLVDLAGNVHSIKEAGKAGEKGLKEKTFGPRGDYQLKVVYKDNEPVYALFMGGYGEEPREFCTAEELRQCYERKTGLLAGYGISYGDDDCFSHMGDVIENFNETFMQGNFVPQKNKTKGQQQDKTVTELADELKALEQQEQKAKKLLSQYQQIPQQKDIEV